MTSIDFYTGADDPLDVAARIVAKAWRQHGHVRVLTPDPATTAALDRRLWTVPATGEMVERLGLKAGVKLVAADLSAL